MRQLAIECGYTAASIRERIYCASNGAPDGPMAGVLLYTAASDSEGTLGGLVGLGEPKTLGRLLDQALYEARLCASDPLCAEHHPRRDGQRLHAGACHACMFAPETSCERGNRYLDRAVLVETVETGELAFFKTAGGS
jgi:MrfA Zn-binding domain